MKGYQWKFFHDISDVNLARDWDELLKRIHLTSFLYHRKWYKSLIDSSYFNSDLNSFLVLYHSKKAIAIFPLEYRIITRFGIKLRAWLLNEVPNLGVSGFIIDPKKNDHWLPLLIEALKNSEKNQWDLLLFQNMPMICKAIVGYNLPIGYYRSIEYSHDSKYIDCREHSYKERRIVKRLSKRLAEYGEIRTYFYRSLDELENGFEEFLKVEAAGFKGEMKTALLYDAKQQRFYRSLLHHFGQSGNCLIHVLKVNNKPIASQFSLLIGNTYYMLKIGFDEDYKSFSPGTILIAHTIKHFSNNPDIDTIHFVTGLKWHDQWKPSITRIYNHYIYKITLKGFLALMVELLISLLRKLKRGVSKRRNSIRDFS